MDQDHAGVRIPPPLLYIAALVLGAAIHYLVWPLTFTLPDLGAVAGETLQIFSGILLVVIGVIGTLLSVIKIVRIGDNPDPTKPTSAIITAGPYRISRNPMYLSVALVYLGIGLGLGSLWIIIFFIPLIYSLQRIAIIPEERYLESKFGDEYLNYKASVRRWL